MRSVSCVSEKSLSRFVDTFSSRILYPMLLLSGNYSIAAVLSWVEVRGLWTCPKVEAAKAVGPYPAIHSILWYPQFFSGFCLSNFLCEFHCLYFVFMVVLPVFCHVCSLLILLIISQILENGLSTFFIPHHKCRLRQNPPTPTFHLVYIVLLTGRLKINLPWSTERNVEI